MGVGAGVGVAPGARGDVGAGVTLDCKVPVDVAWAVPVEDRPGVCPPGAAGVALAIAAMGMRF